MCNPRETLSDLIMLKINKLVKTILRLKTYIGVPLLRYCVLVNLGMRNGPQERNFVLWKDKTITTQFLSKT